jgi:hypothetical protein
MKRRELEDEPTWLKRRISKLHKLRRSITDPVALSAIDELIAESKQRLSDLLNQAAGP